MPGGYDSMKDKREFLSYMSEARRASPHTVKLYRTSIRSYIEHLQAHGVGCRASTFDLVNSWIASMPNAAPRTVRARLSAVRSFHVWLAATGRTAGNPAALTRAPKVPDALRTSFTRREIEQVRRGAPTMRHRVIVALLYDCGLRVSEAATAERAHLDTDSWRLTVRGKGGKVRTVPIIGENARCDLERWLELADPAARYLMPGQTAGHLHPNTVARILAGAAELAGHDPKRWHPHALRHARAEHLRALGYEPFWIQRFLGHASIAHTARYVNPPIEEAPTTPALPGELADAIKLLAGVLERADS